MALWGMDRVSPIMEVMGRGSSQATGLPPLTVDDTIQRPSWAPGTATGVAPQSDADALETLIRSLDFGPRPQQPKPSLRHTIFGAISDALIAASQARAGGAPRGPGAFAQERMAGDEKYRQEMAAYDENRAKTINTIRAGSFAESERAKRELENIKAKVSAAGSKLHPITKSYDDGSGIPIVKTKWYDDQGDLIKITDGEPAGYPPFVQPAIPGVQGAEVIPKRIGYVGSTPPAPPGAETDFRKDVAFKTAMDALRPAQAKIYAHWKSQAGQDPGILDKVWQATLNTVGESAWGTVFDKTRPYANYASTVRAALNSYVLKMTGQQFAEAAFNRYLGEFPRPWDDPETAEIRFDNVLRMITADMDMLLATYPHIAAGSGGALDADGNPKPRGKVSIPGGAPAPGGSNDSNKKKRDAILGKVGIKPPVSP